MGCANCKPTGLALGADFHSVSTPRLEGAAASVSGQVRRVACDDRKARSRMCDLARGRQAAQKRSRIRMLRRLQHIRSGAKFRDTSCIQNKDAIGQAREKQRIMSNQDHREAEPFANRAKELQHIVLRHGIKRGSRLIGNQQRRIAGNRLRDQHALTLASAQFVRIRTENPFGRFWENGFQHAQRFLTQRAAIRGRVRRDYVADLLANANRRMKGQRWLLKNQSDARSANAL